MTDRKRSLPGGAVLFACGRNSVRSPMAAAIARQLFGDVLEVRSAGARKGELDYFAVVAMAEIGIDISEHRPMTFEDLEDWDGLDYDVIVTLAPEAHHRALELTHRLTAKVEYWPMADPTAIEGNREQRLNAYRAVRDELRERIKTRFGLRAGGQEQRP